MQYMLIMRDDDADAVERRDGPFEEMLERMGRYNASMQAEGVLVSAQGLADPETGVVVDFSADPPLVTDGPYVETKEILGGFVILEAASMDEALAIAREWPSLETLPKSTVQLHPAYVRE